MKRKQRAIEEFKRKFREGRKKKKLEEKERERERVGERE